MELSFDEEDENDPENMADPMIVEKLFKVRMLILCPKKRFYSKAKQILFLTNDFKSNNFGNN